MNGGRLVDKYEGDQIYGIYQTHGGCWFDSLLMCMFISDASFIFDNILNYKFTKEFVKSIIKILRDEIIIPVLNKKKAKTSKKIRKKVMNINPEMGGLPFSGFNQLINMFKGKDKNPSITLPNYIINRTKICEIMGWIIFIKPNYTKFQNIISSILLKPDSRYKKKIYSNFIIFQKMADKGLIKIPFNIKMRTIENKYIKYQLDSISVGAGEHEIAFLTIKGKQYLYDNEWAKSNRKMIKFDWYNFKTKKINTTSVSKNKKWVNWYKEYGLSFGNRSELTLFYIKK